MAPEQLFILGLGFVLGLVLFYISVESTPMRMLVALLMSVAFSIVIYQLT